MVSYNVEVQNEEIQKIFTKGTKYQRLMADIKQTFISITLKHSHCQSSQHHLSKSHSIDIHQDEPLQPNLLERDVSGLGLPRQDTSS